MVMMMMEAGDAVVIVGSCAFVLHSTAQHSTAQHRIVYRRGLCEIGCPVEQNANNECLLHLHKEGVGER